MMRYQGIRWTVGTREGVEAALSSLPQSCRREWEAIETPSGFEIKKRPGTWPSMLFMAADEPKDAVFPHHAKQMAIDFSEGVSW